jgi:MFS-type transporter involved in bile tolerance (Atg22 family)
MVFATIISAAAAPLLVLGGLPAAAIGMACWGFGTGAQDSIMRAIVAKVAPQQRRATAFGIMNAVYGVSWFGGSVLLGVLDDISIWGVVLMSLLLQLTAVPIFLRRAARPS